MRPMSSADSTLTLSPQKWRRAWAMNSSMVSRVWSPTFVTRCLTEATPLLCSFSFGTLRACDRWSRVVSNSSELCKTLRRPMR